MISYNWHQKYLGLAKHVATWSKDPSKQIGAVAVGDVGEILATGFNGLPRGIADTEFRLTNREEKYKLVVHAEMNCIYNATHNGVSLRGATLYVWGLPVCSECAKGVIQVGIKHVVMPHEGDVIPFKWAQSFMATADMFEEAGVTYERISLSDGDQPIEPSVA